MPVDKQIKPLIIIGAGPAGLTASIYASRYKIEHLVIGEALGGLAFEAHKVCNFPTEAEISGMDLIAKIQKHFQFLGGELVTAKVIDIQPQKDVFQVFLENGKSFFGKTILLALGTKHRHLSLAEESRFLGKGISYCATCDAMFYKDKTVAVVGGSNSAHTASLYLAKICRKVYQIYRRDKMRGETAWVDQVLSNPKIEVIYNREVKALQGKEKLSQVILNQPYHGKEGLAVEGLFVEIGTVPPQDLIKKLNLETNEGGYIKVDAGQKTSQKEIWAAGDVTSASNNFRQIITACSEGSVAVADIFKFLQTKQ